MFFLKKGNYYMNLLTDYTQFHGAKPYFTTFYIQLCSCRMSSIIQNCLCGYNLVIGAALPYKHTTCIPRRNDVETTVSTWNSRGVFVGWWFFSIMLKGLKHGLHMQIHEKLYIFSGDKMCTWLNLVFWRPFVGLSIFLVLYTKLERDLDFVIFIDHTYRLA